MSPQTLSKQIAALEDLDLDQLRAEWRRRWGEPPALRSRELLAHAAAYRLQVDVFGDLEAPIRRRLAELGRRFAEDRGFRPTSGPQLRPGCTVVREWGGVRHEVKVLEEGFSYGGRPFASLSRIAEHITGVKRSGVLFFGLKPKVGAHP